MPPTFKAVLVIFGLGLLVGGCGTTPGQQASTPLTLEYRDAKLAEVVDRLSKAAELNVSLGSGVAADMRVSLVARGIDPRDALGLLLTSNQLVALTTGPRSAVIVPAGSRVAQNFCGLSLLSYAADSKLARVDQASGAKASSLPLAGAGGIGQPSAHRKGQLAADTRREEDEPVVPDAPPTFRWQAPNEASVGEKLEVRLTVGTSVPLRGLPLQVSFSADKLRLVSVVEGRFFQHQGALTSFTSGGDASSGELRAAVLRNEASGARGQGDVLVLRFEAIAAGPARVSLTQAQPIGADLPVLTPVLPVFTSIDIR
jgi:hypothetical protein